MLVAQDLRIPANPLGLVRPHQVLLIHLSSTIDNVSILMAYCVLARALYTDYDAPACEKKVRHYRPGLYLGLYLLPNRILFFGRDPMDVEYLQ